MPTNLALDSSLVEEAVKLGNHRTKKEAVTAALREYVQANGGGSSIGSARSTTATTMTPSGSVTAAKLFRGERLYRVAVAMADWAAACRDQRSRSHCPERLRQ
jgi:Arc/MetJ family transcription regulator